MKKVLVIEDDPGISESLQYLLEDSGYEVVAFEDGKIVHINLDGHKPDIILMDYWLPNENGGELTRKLKQNNETKHIPVIVISASYNIREVVEKVGADDFVPKPYDINDLLEKIEKHTVKMN